GVVVAAAGQGEADGDVGHTVVDGPGGRGRRADVAGGIGGADGEGVRADVQLALGARTGLGVREIELHGAAAGVAGGVDDLRCGRRGGVKGQVEPTGGRIADGVGGAPPHGVDAVGGEGGGGERVG